MSTPTLTTGDDSILPVQLYKDGSDFVINGTATVKASVVTKDRKTILIPAVTLSNATAGSDWFTSLVVATFTATETNAIPVSKTGISALLEIQVDDSGKLTWFEKIKILRGTIDQ